MRDALLELEAQTASSIPAHAQTASARARTERLLEATRKVTEVMEATTPLSTKDASISTDREFGNYGDANLPGYEVQISGDAVAHSRAKLAKATEVLVPVAGLPVTGCYTVVTMLLHCCYTVVALLLGYCYIIAALLLHTLLVLHSCYIAFTLLLHCRNTVIRSSEDPSVRGCGRDSGLPLFLRVPDPAERGERGQR
jgi:hypothetical protein